MLPNVMTHKFSQVPRVSMPRSIFQRDFTCKTSFDTDYIIPIYSDEVLPGDTFVTDMSAVVRMNSPLVKPLLDDLYLETYFFYIPNRLIWTNWEEFMGQVDDISAGVYDPTDYTIPTLDETKAPLSTTGFTANSLFDYLGFPILQTGIDDLVAFYSRGYNLVYNSFFRDQNLTDVITVDTGNGPDDLSASAYVLRKACKHHDYFTSALPWQQKGTAVSVPLGTDAPIYGKNMDFDDTEDTGNMAQIRDAYGSGGALMRLKTSGSNLFGNDSANGSRCKKGRY